MRIISKYRDYYDGGLTYGIDMSRVYLREYAKLSIRELSQEIGKRIMDKLSLPGGYFLVGFCGEVYLGRDLTITPDRWGNNYNVDPDKRKDYIVYGDDVFHYKLEETRESKAQVSYSYYKDYDIIKPGGNEKKTNRWGWLRWDIRDVEKTQEECREIFSEIFVKYNTPIWIIGREKNHIEINPVLKEVSFYKIFDTYRAFQQIEQYLGTMLVKDTEIDVPVGTDEQIAASKGYDERSFRKDPGQKKRTRRTGKFKNKNKK